MKGLSKEKYCAICLHRGCKPEHRDKENPAYYQCAKFGELGREKCFSVGYIYFEKESHLTGVEPDTHGNAESLVQDVSAG